ncbi:MAG: S24 family peptidase [Eubacteriales bacterium]|nr:S24 family peptidase [Eubacteriales bacterium]
MSKINEIIDLKTFANRLSDLIDDSDETTYTLADKLGLTPATISRYTNAIMKPKVPTVKSLAQIFNVNDAWLMGYDVSKSCNEYKPSNEIYDIPGVMPLPNTYKRPRLGTIACGEPILAEENIEAYDDIPDNIKCDFTLICKGDSMINARINDGDIVYIKQQSQVDNGEIAAVLIDNEATLKRVYIYEDKVVLQPENTKYPPFVYTKEEMNDIRILGKAVGFTSLIS